MDLGEQALLLLVGAFFFGLGFTRFWHLWQVRHEPNHDASIQSKRWIEAGQWGQSEISLRIRTDDGDVYKKLSSPGGSKKDSIVVRLTPRGRVVWPRDSFANGVAVVSVVVGMACFVAVFTT